MKKQLTTLMVLSMLAAPVMAQSLDNQAFEAQVFHNETAQPMQLGELSAQEMKETEGAFLQFAALALGGGAIGAWGNHAYSYAKTGQPASVDSTLKATGNGMLVGASLYGGGRAYQAVTPHTGTVSNWIRVKDSYSRTLDVPTKSVTWGSNRHHRQSIGNETMRNLNASLRNSKAPGSSWRVQDKGHFHLWKRR